MNLLTVKVQYDSKNKLHCNIPVKEASYPLVGALLNIQHNTQNIITLKTNKRVKQKLQKC
jgi:hypothetical protein